MEEGPKDSAGAQHPATVVPNALVILMLGIIDGLKVAQPDLVRVIAERTKKIRAEFVDQNPASVEFLDLFIRRMEADGDGNG